MSTTAGNRRSGIAGSAWAESDLEQRQRLQAAFFPDGVIYEDGATIGTTKTSLFFARFAASEVEKSKLVDQTFTSWNPLTSWRRIEALRSAA
jgi:hypothetical protein